MWAKEDMWGLLRAMLLHPQRLPLVCIIDALDECAKDSNGWLLDHLAGLQQETDFPFTLVISSQCSEDDIAGHVLSERFEFVVIDMDSKEEIRSDADKVVPSLVSNIIRETPALAGLEDYLSDELQLLMNQPAATLLTAKTWLGRLAHPQIGWTLASLSISEQIRLSDNGVDCLYETVLRQVSADNQLWAGKALSWISHSYRPLKIDEICIAISIDRKATDMFTAFEDRIGPLDMIHDLTSVLGPLVRIDRDEIHLVHRSLKKFLIDEKTKTKDEWYSFEYTAAHAEISDTCLAYLSYLLKKDILQILRDRDPSQMFEENIELHTLIPFDSRRLGLLLYASEYWPKHYQQSAKVTCSPSAFTQVLEFLRGNEASTWYHINRLLEGCISDKDTFSPLVVAAKLGLPNVIGEFLKEAEPGGCDYETALNLAAINGQEEVVEELLKTAKFSKELELQFSTALMESSRMGHISVVKRLLFAADQRSISNENLGLGVALSVSAGNGHTDIVNLLLDKGVPVNYIHNNLTPLQHAAKNGREQVVLVLLKSPGISISGGTIIQKSPMHLAAQNGYLAIVGLLLEAGYSPAIAEGSDGSVADNDGEESEDNEGSEDSQENEDNEDIEDIEDKEYSEGNEDDNSEVSDDSNDSNNSNGGRNITSPLHLAAGYGHLKVVNRILDVNTKLATIKDGLGMNALHWAARSGHLHVVKRLMELGVSVDETDNEGMQPLHYAAEGGHTQVVRALLDREADPTELGGYFSLTAPIHIASRGGHVDVITALVERGASIDQKSSNGYAAIHAAYAHPTAVRRLIDLGANVNALSVLGSSPLMWAAQAGSVEVVKLLLAAGAIVQTPNKNNSTALHRAAQSDSWGTVETLLSSGASPFARRSPSGVTPIDIAVMTGHEGIARNMVNWIVDNAYWRDPFRMVVDTCTEETIELWLNHRPQDKNTTSSLGTPALLRFAARGISQHVNSLLASEIGKRVCDAKGRVAIDVALHPEVRRLLDPHAYGKNTTKDTTGAAKNSPEGFQGEGSVGNGPSEEGCTMLNGDRPQYNNASYTIRCGVCNENPIEGFFYRNAPVHLLHTAISS